MSLILAALKSFASTGLGKAVVSGAASAIASNIGRKNTPGRIDMKAMRKDAEAAGFNPLTVMRNGGMSGYFVPPMSSQTFAGQMVGGAINSFTDSWLNKDIDLYNEEMRGIAKQQAYADLSLTKAQIEQMNAPEDDPYAGYGQYIPVRVGNNVQQLDVTVARRFGILPNDRLVGEDITTIKGELPGEFLNVAGLEIGNTALIPAPLTGTDEKGVPNDNLIEMALKAIMRTSPGTHVTVDDIMTSELPPLSGGWFNEWSKNWPVGAPNLSGLMH